MLIMQFGVELVMGQFLEVDMTFILIISVKVHQMDVILPVLIIVMKKMELQEDKITFMLRKWKFFKLNFYNIFFKFIYYYYYIFN